MNESSSQPSQIERLFRDLSDAEISDVEQVPLLLRAGWPVGFGWDELLRSSRILMISEAGAGKTYECQAQQARLWESGEPAFFLDLATLSTSAVRDMLSPEEEARLEHWLRSQSEIATFFLDSIDELNLTLGKFDQALKRLSKAVAGQLGRARIVITTRPVPFDRKLIAKYLPIPERAVAAPTAEAFADMMMARRKKEVDSTKPKQWRNVGLLPLSSEQARAFATLQGVTDPDALLADIRLRDADEFAERPQDLIELCSDWEQHRQIRTHRDQVEANVSSKLKPRTERRERAELSEEKALDGASRLALAAMLARKLTLRYSASADRVNASEAALDVSKVLRDWGGEERAALMERALFGFASYGRVRFHHRSVVEFLAAARLRVLLARGAPIKAVKRLLFAETAQGTRVVRPSLRPVAAWLALSCDAIFDELVIIDPSVALDYGDPQTLRPSQRVRALGAYVGRYGKGGWRGMRVPRIQVHRFATPELGNDVERLWAAGIENEEVRDLLLTMMGVGKFHECADIAHAVAMDSGPAPSERCLAIDVLIQLGDKRVHSISASIETDTARWSEIVARGAIPYLFPSYLPVARLTSILRRIQEDPHTIGDLNYRLPREIETADISIEYLDQLRQALTDLLLEAGTIEPNKFPHLTTKRDFLVPALLATCVRQLALGVSTEDLTFSSVIALRLSEDMHSEKEGLGKLRCAIGGLPAEVHEAVFWRLDGFQQGLCSSKDAWNRVYDLLHHDGIQLDVSKDDVWVRNRLSDPHEPLDHREMMLWVEMVVFNRPEMKHREVLESLKPLVADAPSLVDIIDKRLMPTEVPAETKQLLARQKKYAEDSKRKEARAHASWVTFWREIAADPSGVFAPGRAENTAWNLWQAVERSGEESRASGWNRKFIEAQFGKPVADNLRTTMMEAWRKDRPTLRSERPADQKGTYLVKWQFGLAGIAAEAEDANWAKRLTQEEAELACRYAPLEFNGFPSWLESLAVEYPTAIDNTLGEELAHSMRELVDTNDYSIFLQNISHASAILVALFVPRIRVGLAEILKVTASPNHPQFEHNLRQAVEILLKYGSDADRRFIEECAKRRLADAITGQSYGVWLPALLYVNPTAGVEMIEQGLSGVPVSKYGTGVQLFAQLFGRDHTGIGVDLRLPAFTSSLLLRLVRVAYQHVRFSEDAVHEGAYEPDVRDNGERGRDAVLGALLSTTGLEGWKAKLEMANDTLFAHFKDRAIILAHEKAAEEADSNALSEAEFLILDKRGEAPPKTAADMFLLLQDRLDDIDDLLLQDISPREAWAGIKDERVMRRELARELKNAARGSYTVDQEAVTADEKETDIRLRSTVADQEAVIELKLGDRRPARDLFRTINDQLVAKYMAPENCRAGCLLVTITEDRIWKHPQTGVEIDFDTLIAVLNGEAARLAQSLGSGTKVMAKGLDLRPRLGTEKVTVRTKH